MISVTLTIPYIAYIANGIPWSLILLILRSTAKRKTPTIISKILFLSKGLELIKVPRVVGNGATWGKLKPETKIQINEKKSKNFEFCLSYESASGYPPFPTTKNLKKYLYTKIYLYIFSKNVREYIRRENLNNKIAWNYSKIT